MRTWQLPVLTNLVMSVAGARPEGDEALIEFISRVTTKPEVAPIVDAVAKARGAVLLAKGAVFHAAVPVAGDVAAREVGLPGIDHKPASLAEGEAALSRLRDEVSSILHPLDPSAHDDGIGAVLSETVILKMKDVVRAIEALPGHCVLASLHGVVFTAFRNLEKRLGSLEERAGKNLLADALTPRLLGKGSRGRAAANFRPAWTHSRGIDITPPEANARELAMASAAATGDVEELSRLLIGRDSTRVRVAEAALPGPAVFRSPRSGECDLLEIAAGSGAAATVRFLLGFAAVPVTASALLAAVAMGDAEIVRTLWDRFPPAERSADFIVDLAKTAADFHQLVLLAWLVRDAAPEVAERVGVVCLNWHLADAVLTLVEIGWDIAAGNLPVVNAMARWPDMRLLEVVAPRSRLGWVTAIVRADSGIRTFLLQNEPSGASRRFVRFATMTSEHLAGTAEELVAFLARGGRVVPEFAVLLRTLGVDPTDGDAELLAWMAVEPTFAMKKAKVTAAHLAVLSGNEAWLRQLIARRAKIDTRDGLTGKRPVEWANDRGRDDLVEILRAAGVRDRPPCLGVCGGCCCCCRDPCVTCEGESYSCLDPALLVDDEGRPNVGPWPGDGGVRITLVCRTLLAIVAVCLSFALCGKALSIARSLGLNDRGWMTGIAFLSGSLFASLLATCFFRRGYGSGNTTGGAILLIGLMVVAAVGIFAETAVTQSIRGLTWTNFAFTSMMLISVMGGCIMSKQGMPWPVCEFGRTKCWRLWARIIMNGAVTCVGVTILVGSILAFVADPGTIWLAVIAGAAFTLLTRLSGLAIRTYLDYFALTFDFVALIALARSSFDSVRPWPVVIAFLQPLALLFLQESTLDCEADPTPAVTWTLLVVEAVGVVIGVVASGLVLSLNRLVGAGATAPWVVIIGALVVALGLCVAGAVQVRRTASTMLAWIAGLTIFAFSISLIIFALVSWASAAGSWSAPASMFAARRPDCLESADEACARIENEFLAVRVAVAALVAVPFSLVLATIVKVCWRPECCKEEEP